MGNNFTGLLGSRRRGSDLRIRSTSVAKWCFAFSVALAGGRAYATPVSATDVFLAIDEASINNIGISTTPVLFIGADTVIPNGLTGGTTGTATSSDGSVANYTLKSLGSTAFPNQISTGTGGAAVPYNGSNPSLLQPWTLTYTNGGNQTVVTTPSSVGFSPAPFANNVTITGGTTTPTVNWTGTGNGVFINIFNKNLCTDGSAGSSGAACAANPGHPGWPDTVKSFGSLPASGSFQIPASAGITTTGSYVIEVAEAMTHDGTTNTVHHNEAAISRAEFNFSVLPSNAPPNVNLPMVDSAGVFHFNLTPLPTGFTYIDPSIAAGYVYQIGSGNPNFASVLLPILPNQTDPYEIEWNNDLNSAFVVGGQTFTFPGLGVSEFEVRNIDAANGLDPSNPTAFITGLTFESGGTFTGTMTPIVSNASVPEPTSLSLLAGALGCGLWFRRRKC
jgi:hypothetical protein